MPPARTVGRPARSKCGRSQRWMMLTYAVLVVGSGLVACQLAIRAARSVYRADLGLIRLKVGLSVNGVNVTSHRQHGLITADMRNVVVSGLETYRATTFRPVEIDVGSLLQKATRTACPNLKAMSALVNDREMNLTDEFSMEQLQRVVCPNQPGRLREVAADGTRQLAQSRNSTTNDSLLGLPGPTGLRCGDYLYLPGGHWKPATCLPRWKVAIVVPYRNRAFQLSIFLRYMIPFLQKQRLEFAIYLVNQANDLAFNRGMLLNVGFTEALHFAAWDCFVFHDVDHLPQSELNSYGCVDLPRHFISGADNRHYKVPYSTSFGGVTGFTTAQFRAINGFGNVYWGWCCEDDDMEARVRVNKLKKTRYRGSVGYYKAITVHHDKAKRVSELQTLNRRSLKTLRSRLKTDGLNNLRYEVRHLELATLYTNISVDIQRL